jgi:hypothetical protein
MRKSTQHSHFSAREVGTIGFTAQDAKDYALLSDVGINLPPAQVKKMMNWAMDDQQGGITSGSIATPVQFLQNWLPGFVKVITAARKIDDLCGISTIGSWEDEEIVQGILEPIGNAVPYGDYTNVPLASWNTNFVLRTVVRFEKGIKVGNLESARAGRIRIDTASEKRSSAALSLEISRNLIGFNGYNNGTNKTYGFLNDPALSAYVTVATGVGGLLWSQKTFNEIIADIRAAVAKIQIQSQDTINPEDTEMTLAVATSVYQYLTVVANLNGYSVKKWIEDTYPKMRIVSAPQLNAANGGANVFYLYAESVEDGASDDSRTWIQVVPAKFQALGVEKQAKAYVEDYTNATAGVMLKRPYAVVRYSGV